MTIGKRAVAGFDNPSVTLMFGKEKSNNPLTARIRAADAPAASPVWRETAGYAE
jgi:hypothetical protein